MVSSLFSTKEQFQQIIMRCICCEKIVYKEFDSPINQKISPEQDAWINAGVHDFIVGYGSTKFDTCRFIICVCDDCLEEKLLHGIIIQDKNYPYF